MNPLRHFRTYLLACSLVLVLPPLKGHAQQNTDASKTVSQPAITKRDGQHDFDFLVPGRLISGACCIPLLVLLIGSSMRARRSSAKFGMAALI